MGYYFDGLFDTGKTEQLILQYDAMEITKPDSFDKIPEDKAMITIVDNGTFEAAGLAYNEKEFEVMTSDRDNRPRRYVLMNKELAHRLVGYPRRK